MEHQPGEDAPQPEAQNDYFSEREVECAEPPTRARKPEEVAHGPSS